MPRGWVAVGQIAKAANFPREIAARSPRTRPADRAREQLRPAGRSTSPRKAPPLAAATAGNTATPGTAAPLPSQPSSGEAPGRSAANPPTAEVGVAVAAVAA